MDNLPDGQIRIVVKTLTGLVISLNVDLTWTVEDLKQKIQVRTRKLMKVEIFTLLFSSANRTNKVFHLRNSGWFSVQSSFRTAGH